MPETTRKKLEFVFGVQADEDKSSSRLDKFLCDKFSQFSRARIQKLIADGMVLVDGEQQKAGHRLKPGQKISITVPPLKNLAVEAQAIPLDILYEDEYLAVINKPAGMVTHPGAGVDSGTLVHALLHHMQGSLSGIGGVARPGIVHRLDKDTSGLLVVAKDDLTHRHLAEQIQKKTAQRIYTAILEGDLKQEKGSVVAPIGRHPTKRTQMAITTDGRQATSHYKVLKHTKGYVLVEVKLETGRTHQIRVHTASLNCPVVGDLIYNKKTTGTAASRKRLGLTGQALHATKLSFVHPKTGKLLEFVAPLPEDWQGLLNKLWGEV